MEQLAYYSIRIHPSDYSAADLEEKFSQFCTNNSIERYVMTYEQDAARPHYHTLVQQPEKSLFKLKQSFKAHLPDLKGNKSFAFSQVTEPLGMLNYICKGGDYRVYSNHFTVDQLDAAKDTWLKNKGTLAQEKHNKVKKTQKTAKDLTDLFILTLATQQKIKPLNKNYFVGFLTEFILANSIINFNRNFMEKFYRIYLKIVDPYEYHEYVKKQVSSFYENNF
jgi:hypothetical protein